MGGWGIAFCLLVLAVLSPKNVAGGFNSRTCSLEKPCPSYMVSSLGWFTKEALIGVSFLGRGFFQMQSVEEILLASGHPVKGEESKSLQHLVLPCGLHLDFMRVTPALQLAIALALGNSTWGLWSCHGASPRYPMPPPHFPWGRAKAPPASLGLSLQGASLEVGCQCPSKGKHSG